MDILIRNIPEPAKNCHLDKFIKARLKELDIHVSYCHRLKKKTFAILTLHSAEAAGKFLSLYGTFPGASGHVPRPLMFHGSRLTCVRSNKPAQLDPRLLACLQNEQNKRDKKKLSQKSDNRSQKRARGSIIREFGIESLRCGQWEYEDASPVFYSCYKDDRKGTLHIGGGRIMVFLLSTSGHYKSARIEIPYSIIYSATTGSAQQPCLTLTLYQAPIILNLLAQQDQNQQADTLVSLMRDVRLSDRKSRFDSERIGSLHPDHTEFVGNCFVYQILLSNSVLISEVSRTIKAMPAAPDVHRFPALLRERRSDMLHLTKGLKYTLTRPVQGFSLAFPIVFQLQALYQNGVLYPGRLIKLLPKIYQLASKYPTFAVAEALVHLRNNLPLPDPSSDFASFELESIEKLLEDKVSAYRIERSTLEGGAKRYEHLGIIHRVVVTPCGTYLCGPALEVKNRVLRKYPDNSFFLRVEFKDEDGGQLLRRPGLNNAIIYRERFFNVLNGSIDIAGRLAVFLGFSNSSLRSAMCWFMSPFYFNENLLFAQRVIQDLGDFSHIRTPARNAARIGQAFSDATDTIPIPRGCDIPIPDIHRNDRCFTDGVGQISWDLLKEVWMTLRKSKKSPASCLQIRFRGAKGMVALNPTLQGKQICLRPSMVKFEGSEDRDLEITGAGYRNLPMFLNRQFIKILEDLEVPPEAFLKLQQKAVKELHYLRGSATEAANVLEKNHIGTAAQLPSLIRCLDRIGLRFQDDPFVRRVITLSALVQLRDLKYRARIPVEDAVTLYGIVDETGYLRENEVHVVIRDDRHRRRVKLGQALITRAPAMHPGDFQIVAAVEVPEHSPLRNVHNCVVFSQHGGRDLPSQLSGGDLDGDLFNVIFDKSLWPKRIHAPADYPRVKPKELDRVVERHDITDFFIKFMESDQLGYIANTHMIIADHESQGTCANDCITLAELASTAVDFAKTGIPPDMTKFPKGWKLNIKPDFMANSPNVLLGSSPTFENHADLDEDDDGDVDDTDAEIINPDANAVRYYQSNKILGQLFRDIDEEHFDKEMRACFKPTGETGKSSFLNRVWSYVERETRALQWEHHWEFALEVKKLYEENLSATMYNYSPHLRDSLTEAEVFAGIILGRTGGIPDRLVREKIIDMREAIGREFAYIRNWIVYGDADFEDNDDEEAEWQDGERLMNDMLGAGAALGDGEALERSIACLAVGIRKPGALIRRQGHLESFPYVAAEICLKEINRFKRSYGVT